MRLLLTAVAVLVLACGGTDSPCERGERRCVLDPQGLSTLVEDCGPLTAGAPDNLGWRLVENCADESTTAAVGTFTFSCFTCPAYVICAKDGASAGADCR